VAPAECLRDVDGQENGPAKALVVGEGEVMVWPFVLVLLALGLLGLVLHISGAYLLLVVAAVLFISSLVVRRKPAV
jgi:hypothetical protein